MSEKSETTMLGTALIVVFLIGWCVIGFKFFLFAWQVYGDRVILVAGVLVTVSGLALIAAARAAGVR